MPQGGRGGHLMPDRKSPLQRGVHLIEGDFVHAIIRQVLHVRPHGTGGAKQLAPRPHLVARKMSPDYRPRIFRAGSVRMRFPGGQPDQIPRPYVPGLTGMLHPTHSAKAQDQQRCGCAPRTFHQMALRRREIPGIGYTQTS
jgi:hypothetical protein